MLRSRIHMLMPGQTHANPRTFLSQPALFFVNIEMKANVGEQIPQVSKERRADPHGI